MFIGPEVEIVSHAEKRETCVVLEQRDQRDIHESDESAMARFAAENPDFNKRS